MIDSRETLLVYMRAAQIMQAMMTPEQQAELRRITEQRLLARCEAIRAEFAPNTDEYKAGAAVANAGGKQKTNPYEGGSTEWWNWHNGYNETKKAIEAAKRRSA